MTKKNDEDGLRGLAIASIICGVGSWIVFAAALAPLSVVFAILSLKSKDNTTRTLGIVGLVIGIVALSLLIYSLIIISAIKF